MELAYLILQVTKETETFHTQKHATSNSRATFCFTDDVFQEVKMGTDILERFLRPFILLYPIESGDL